jgi:hypothetical protein
MASIIIYYLSDNNNYINILEQIKDDVGEYHPIFRDVEYSRNMLIFILLIPFMMLILLILLPVLK